MKLIVLAIVFIAAFGCTMAGDGNMISEEQAVSIAKEAVEGKIVVGPENQAEVSLVANEYVVIFKNSPGPLVPGPDYVARVTIDAKTGKVKQILGSQD